MFSILYVLLFSLNDLYITFYYNQSEVKPLGKKHFKVVNPKNKKKYSMEFLIVSGAYKSIVGLRASEHLQLLTINKQNILVMDCDAVESGVSIACVQPPPPLNKNRGRSICDSPLIIVYGDHMIFPGMCGK